MKRNKRIVDVYQLSPMQAGIFFRALCDKKKDPYFVQPLYTLKGQLDHEMLHSAWQTVTNQHTVLRTGLIWEKVKEPLQYVLESVSVPFSYHDWRHHDNALKEKLLQQLLAQDLEQYFDFSQAPLNRITLIRYTDDECRMLWSHHHVLIDGWCGPILLGEVFETYHRLVNGLEPNLIQRPPYKAYVEWLKRQNKEAALLFWRQYLAKLDSPTRLPKTVFEQSLTDHQMFSMTISKEETQKLMAFSRHCHVTLNTILQASIALLLSTYCQKSDIILGITVSGRSINLESAEDMIGLLINTLPLRAQVCGSHIFTEFLSKIQSDTQKTNDHLYLPLAEIQSLSQLHDGLFDALLVFENFPVGAANAMANKALTVTNIPSINKTEYPLTILIGPGESLHITFSYQTSHFNKETIQRLSQHLYQCLQNMQDTYQGNSHCHLEDIHCLTKQESKQLQAWEKMAISANETTTILALFETQVRRSANKVAVVYHDKKMTYQYLDEKSNQLAHFLKSHNLAPQTPIAFLLERSLDLPVVMLGILKAGHFYVPLNPEDPPQRWHWMLNDAKSPLLITHTSLLANKHLQNNNGAICCLEKAWPKIMQQASHHPEISIHQEHMAYMIYTSGSTGEPKGVMAKHKSLCNCLTGIRDLTKCDDADIFLALTTLSFDVAAFDYFLPLAIGGKIVIADEEIRKDPPQLLSLMKKETISVLQATPSLLSLMTDDTNGLDMLPAMKIFSAGEALPWTLCQKLSHQHTVMNIYGPTEATVYTTLKAIKLGETITIGHPISNVHVYILDTAMRPVPIGIAGEIYIGGMGLARGYWQQTALTAERFVPNPFSVASEGIKNLRLYRSGDQARYLEDGRIEFLGRLDDQVKLRGYRIELGDIINTLEAHPTVRQAHVLLQPQHQLLLGYIVPRIVPKCESTLCTTERQSFHLLHGCAISELEKEMLTYLKTILPAYMIPTALFCLDKIPLTPSGKIDVRALPHRIRTSHPVDTEVTSDTQKELINIWTSVLYVSRIGLHDHFFKLGGHSLNATQIVSRIRQLFNIELPIKAIFDYPTVYTLSKTIDNLKQETQRSRIQKTADRPKYLPLSFSQQRLWFIEKLTPQTSLYNIPLGLELQGNLNKKALEQALNKIIERHEALRTVFPEQDNGQPYQKVLPHLSCGLNEHDLAIEQMSANEQWQCVLNIKKDMANHCFDLKKGPLLETRLIHLNKKCHILLLTFHHIICDGWSLKIFFNELASCYNALKQHTQPDLPPLTIQYSDYSLWQREKRQGRDIEKQLAYWKNQLANTPKVINIGHKIRPAERTYEGASHKLKLGIATTEALMQLGEEHHSSLYMILLAIFQSLLYRYTHEDTIVVGSPVANRQNQETEPLIGIFVNSVAMKTTFHGKDRFIDVLLRVKETVLEAQQNQEMPFEQLVEQLKIIRSTNHNPIFQVMFDLENNHPDSIQTVDIFHDLKSQFLESSYDKEKMDLSLFAKVEADGLCLNFHYAKDLLEENDVQRFAKHFEQLTKNILHNKTEFIANVKLLKNEEWQSILYSWNDTEDHYQALQTQATVASLFEKQVDMRPQQLAFIFQDQTFSYAELEKKANQMAHLLRNHGVQSHSFVALALERSSEMIISLLGILKAGAAYIPFNPEDPIERLRSMLKDIEISCFITQENVYDRLKMIEKDLNCPLIILDSELKALAKISHTRLSLDIHPKQLVYLMHTSGSTGKPKAVMIEHQSLINRIVWMQTQYQLKSNEKVLQKTPYTFDVSVWELFWPLMAGGTEVMIPPETHKDPYYLLKVIQEQKISVMHFVPAMLTSFLEVIDKPLKNFSTRLVFTSGEVLASHLAQLYHQKTQHHSLHNLYGPTEATIDVTYHPVGQEERHSVPIGKPIANTQVYLLDCSMAPVPIGVIGEIYISGHNLARGYWQMPLLTAEKFVPNPFAKPGSSLENIRLYRSGDHGYYLADGSIVFIGRVDDQIKIRGMRIELGEIMESLNKHKKVKTCFINKHLYQQNTCLTAYVVPKDSVISSSTPNKPNSTTSAVSIVFKDELADELTKRLRHHLKNSLPSHMIPNQFIYIDRLPLTVSGKVDRHMLPTVKQKRKPNDTLPQGNTEIQLAHMWCEVLSVDKVSREDDFFELGGHSLLATQIIARIRQTFQVEVSLHGIFSHPVLQHMADIVNLSIEEEREEQHSSIKRQKRPERLPISFAQHRLWFLDQLLPGKGLYNVPIALKLTGDLNLEGLEYSIQSLIECHESLRTFFSNHSKDDTCYQKILPTLHYDLQANLFDLTKDDVATQTQQVKKMIHEQVNSGFDLKKAPLWRIKLISLSKNEHIIIFTLHHIICDGWSMDILFTQLSDFYNAFVDGTKKKPTTHSWQYADFALWQKAWLQGDTLERQLAYWKEQLSDIPKFIEINQQPRPKELSYQGAYHCHILSATITKQLHALAMKHHCSLFMTLLGIFQSLLYRYSGERNIVVGTPIAGRRYREMEDVVGLFVNTLALKTAFTGRESFSDLLRQIKENTLNAYQNQDVPFEQLVEHLHVERVLNRNPIFQIMFNLDNTSNTGTVAKVALHEINTYVINTQYSAARVDLALSATETNDGEIVLGFQYATDLFSKAYVERLGQNFEIFTQAVLRNSTASIDTLSLLNLGEIRQILKSWNESIAPMECQFTQTLFEQQAEKTPDLVAISDDQEAMTYCQLNQAANKMAYALRKADVGPESTVIIALENSCKLLIALLGTLKSGGAYVPIDPNQPMERLQWILTQTNAAIVITNSDLKDKIQPLLTGKNTFLIDHLLTENWPDSNPEILNQPHHLAYIIYTSGSTGQPKGVMITHHNLSHYLVYAKQNFPTPDNEITLLHSSVAFDMSVTCLYVALIRGGHLRILPTHTGEALTVLPTAIQEANHLKLTPTHLCAFQDKVKRITEPVFLLAAGENLRASHLESWYQSWPKLEVFNEYGPTETTVGCTICTAEDVKKSVDNVPIGKPISGTKIYLLDAVMNLVPIGATGEIYITGHGVSRGYLNKADLSAEKYVPNPFATEKNPFELRLYRSGDLGRYQEDGNIEYLGRIDDQIKIRGFRVELSEIEAAINKHMDISKAVVQVHGDKKKQKQILAYIVPGEFQPSIKEMQEFLAEKLPHYMIPAHFIYIDAIPLTPNGKIDKRALSEYDIPNSSAKNNHYPPDSDLEKKLTMLWAQMLDIPYSSISVCENFFRMGGDSIISIQLAAKARQLGLQITVKDLFSHPTIKELAAQVAKHEPLSSNTQSVLPYQHAVSGCVSLTPIQIWFFSRDLENIHHYNQATMLHLRHKPTANLKKSIHFLLKHHDTLRTRYQHTDTGWEQVVQSVESVFPSVWQHVNYAHIDDDALCNTISQYAQTVQSSLDIEQGPLVRFVLFDCGALRTDRLLIVVHHLLIDGVSWRILLEDLENSYQHLEKNGHPPEISKTHSFQQWSQTLNKYASSAELVKETQYWHEIQKKIAQTTTSKCLQKDSHVVTCDLNIQETEDLLQKVLKKYRTGMNEILLTAFTLAMGDQSGCYELPLALEGHGREDIEPNIDVSRTIGWFTSLFPVLMNLQHCHQADQIVQAIQTIKETFKQIPHKGIGYGVLMHLQKERKSMGTLYPNISFNYLGQWQRTQQKMFMHANESVGDNVADSNQEAYDLSVNCEIRDKQFRLQLQGGHRRYCAKTLESIAAYFLHRLRSIIQCAQDAKSHYSPTDFSANTLSHKKLQARIKMIEENHE